MWTQNEPTQCPEKLNSLRTSEETLFRGLYYAMIFFFCFHGNEYGCHENIDETTGQEMFNTFT